jgi:hypothetical protein
MFFNGLRIQVANAGQDATMGSFADGQVVQYDQANQLLKGGPAFSSGFASGDVPVWNGSTFVPKQNSSRRMGFPNQTTNSVAYVDISSLSLTLNRAGDHVFEYYIQYETSAAAEGIGLRMAYTGTSLGCDYTIDMFTDPATRAPLISANAFGTAVAPQTVGPGVGPLIAIAYLVGSCSVSTGGVLSVQMRAETGGANTVTAHIGSWVHVVAV